MPGHILQAVCGCGYEAELSPGQSEFDFVEVAIAYSSDLSSIETFSLEQIEQQNLQTVIDPFLMTDEEDLFISSKDFQTASDDEKLKAHRILMKKQEGVSNTYLCPRCKNQSLFFHFTGFWD
jgi:hypothetical protein